MTPSGSGDCDVDGIEVLNLQCLSFLGTANEFSDVHILHH